MVKHVLLCSESSTTCVADPRLLSSVDPSVDLQLAFADKSVFAEVAEPGFGSLGMALLLVGQKARLDWEAATTQVANERTLTFVNPLMADKVGLSSKGRIALVALEWFGVQLFMNPT